ncbi:MAG: VOC family protein [Lysobacterales bacterium]
MNAENHSNGNTHAVIGSVALLVHDYNEAIAFFTKKLGFDLLEDSPIDSQKRWVKVAPAGGGCALLLARAVTDEQRSAVGNQAGGRVWLFLETPQFWASFKSMGSCGVEFVEEPRKEAYGHVCVFKDLYGNRWDLLETGVER